MRKSPERYSYNDIYSRAYWFDNHDNMMYSYLNQKNRRDILRENEAIRNNPELFKTLSFGQMQLRIPDVDRHRMGKLFDLDNTDPEQKRKNWQRFLESPMSDPYRVRPRRKCCASNKSPIRGYSRIMETTNT